MIMGEDYFDAGSAQGFKAALIAILREHPYPKQAARTVRNVFERELVPVLNDPLTPDRFVDGLQDAFSTLEPILRDISDEP